jgi:hypothetical protein
MSHVPSDKRDTYGCDFRGSIEFTRHDSGIVDDTSFITAFDNLSRCHVMKLFGVSKLYVLQFAGTLRKRNKYGIVRDEDVKRKSNSLYMLDSFTIEGRVYAGFTIDIPVEHLVFRNPLEMMVHTFDTSHYEMLVSYCNGIPSVPCCYLGSDSLPDQAPFPDSDVANETKRIPVHFH